MLCINVFLSIRDIIIKATLHKIEFINLYVGNIFCDFLFTFLHTKSFLKKGLLKERICSQGTFRVDPFKKEIK